MMFFKRTLMPILVGIMMTGAASAAHAQMADMSKGMAQHQAAAQELVALYNGTRDEASATASYAADDSGKEIVLSTFEVPVQR